MNEVNLKEPILLQADNFTPQTRTPWAGYSIYPQYKKHLPNINRQEAIGESWEFSCDPDFPSKLMNSDKTLSEVMPNCELLIKLLNASSPLSLQVHPADNDPHLKPEECGKPESWLILDSAPGAGIYLGFSRAISKKELRAKLENQENLKDLLQFVPVKPGDYFEIMPGVPHAIGPGLTLLEPQRILFNRSGKTYRLWDWNRTYDQNGQENSKGKPRPLHLEESLRIIDSEHQVGLPFVDSLRKTPHITAMEPNTQLAEYPSNDYYQTTTLTLGADTQISGQLQGGYSALIVLAGELFLTSSSGKTYPLLHGQTALLPQEGNEFRFASKGKTQLALISPKESKWNWKKLS